MVLHHRQEIGGGAELCQESPSDGRTDLTQAKFVDRNLRGRRIHQEGPDFFK
jgi:hypothetical protein